MLAATISKTGSIDNIEIQDLPIPTIKANQLLIKVKACGINPVDWKGVMSGSFQVPYILGSDISGIVEKIGTEVTRFKIGDEVIGSLEWNKQGAFAGYVASEERFIVHKPINLSFEQAAGVPMASLTAWQGLFDKLNIQDGQKILIQAAAGGVGLFALQFAKLKKLHVAATCSASNVEFLKSLGADEVIDYRTTNFINVIKDYDAVFDSIEATEDSYKVLKKGGKYVSITSLNKPLPAELAKQYEIFAAKYLFQSSNTQLSEIVKLIEEEKVKIFIDKTFPLTEIKEALVYQKYGHSKGKNILLVE